MPDDQSDRHPDGAVAVVRRAPFSDNPRVGARGQRTQQRILDAALRAFGETGFHGCNVNRITKLARCSRVSFYQYFASKEDVFAHLAGQVARQLSASTETLDQLTHDVAGWTAMRAWIERYAEIYDRYEPVFNALETDDELAAIARRTGEETVARVHSRLATTTLPPRQLDPVIRLLLETVNHTFEVTGVLRAVAPDAYSSARIEVALTDVLHRTFFGVSPDVNVHPPSGDAPPAIEFDPAMRELLRSDDATATEGAGNRALLAVLASGRDVFVSRGYHHTRVDDLAAAAGISHGAIYRYFKNKAQLARMLNARAIRSVGSTVTEIPDLAALEGPAGKAALRKWLRRYYAAQVNEAAMLRVWVDAALQDPALRAESAPPLDWGRRRMSRYLRRAGAGDADMEAVVMVALFGVFGARHRPAADVEAVAHIIERGFLGQ